MTHFKITHDKLNSGEVSECHHWPAIFKIDGALGTNVGTSFLSLFVQKILSGSERCYYMTIVVTSGGVRHELLYYVAQL